MNLENILCSIFSSEPSEQPEKHHISKSSHFIHLLWRRLFFYICCVLRLKNKVKTRKTLYIFAKWIVLRIWVPVKCRLYTIIKKNQNISSSAELVKWIHSGNWVVQPWWRVFWIRGQKSFKYLVNTFCMQKAGIINDFDHLIVLTFRYSSACTAYFTRFSLLKHPVRLAYQSCGYEVIRN